MCGVHWHCAPTWNIHSAAYSFNPPSKQFDCFSYPQYKDSIQTIINDSSSCWCRTFVSDESLMTALLLCWVSCLLFALDSSWLGIINMETLEVWFSNIWQKHGLNMKAKASIDAHTECSMIHDKYFEGLPRNSRVSCYDSSWIRRLVPTTYKTWFRDCVFLCLSGSYIL